MPLIELVANFGIDAVMLQPNIPHNTKLKLLHLILPTVIVLRERQHRSFNSAMTPEKAYNQELLVSGDILQAERMKAWQSLAQTRTK